MSTPDEELATTMNETPFETAEEFTVWWLRGTDLLPEDTVSQQAWLDSRGIKAVRCECGIAHCRGWIMQRRTGSSAPLTT